MTLDKLIYCVVSVQFTKKYRPCIKNNFCDKYVLWTGIVALSCHGSGSYGVLNTSIFLGKFAIN